MTKITLELDATDPHEGTWDTGAGQVTISLTGEEVAGHAITWVEGEAPAVLAWLLNEYVDTLDEALDLLRATVPTGREDSFAGARRG